MKARILILSLVLLAACEPVEMDYEYRKTLEESTPQAGESYTLTLQATKTVDTKALDLTNDGARLNQYWKSTEKVMVFYKGNFAGTLDVVVPDPASDPKPKTATLSGSVTIHGLAVDDVLTLMIPGRADKKWDYTGQNGVLTGSSSIEDSFDFATATVTINSFEGTTAHTTADAQFKNQQSIYRFDFKENDALKAVKWFTVSSSRTQLVTSRSYTNDAWASNYGDLTVTLTGDGATSPYVSLRNENNSLEDTYSFLVVGGDNALYSGVKTITEQNAPNLGNGNFLTSGVTLTKTDLHHTTGLIGEPDQVL